MILSEISDFSWVWTVYSTICDLSFRSIDMLDIVQIYWRAIWNSVF